MALSFCLSGQLEIPGMPRVWYRFAKNADCPCVWLDILAESSQGRQGEEKFFAQSSLLHGFLSELGKNLQTEWQQDSSHPPFKTERAVFPLFELTDPEELKGAIGLLLSFETLLHTLGQKYTHYWQREHPRPDKPS